MRLATSVAMTLLATAVAASPVSAAGHWSYAQWGVTPNELIAASQGDAQPFVPGPGDRRFNAEQLAVARFSQDGIDYEVRFLFSKPWYQLQAIELGPDKSRCADVKASLTARLGEAPADRREYSMGVRKSVTLTHNWVSSETGERIVYDQMGWEGEMPSSCRVTYTQR